MKIAAVSMVKDESDIIELFIRINARAIDHFFILDNGSSDSTCLILQRLIAEGFPITLSSDTAIGYPQDKITTDLIRHVAAIGEYDWISALDADEFIQADKAELAAALASVPAEHCALMNWATFVPTSDQYFSVENPLWACFRQRAEEFRQYGKVVIPSNMARLGSVTMGNHSFRRNDKKLAANHVLTIGLAHVPVRSAEQLISKAIIGSYKFSIKENRRRAEGAHWDTIARQIRDSGYTISYAALKEIALTYALNAGDPVDGTVLPGRHLGFVDDCIHFPDLAQINLQARYDAFMGALCAEIKTLRAKSKKRFFFF